METATKLFRAVVASTLIVSTLLFFAPPAYASGIAEANSASSALASTGLSLSFAMSGTSNTLLVVDVVSLNEGPPTGCTTNGGTPMHQVANQVNSDTSQMAMYDAVGLTGTQTITCTATSGGLMIFIATSYTGVSQTTTPDSLATFSTVSAHPQTYSTSVVSTGSWLASNIYSDNQAPTAGTGAFLRQIGSNVTIAAFDSNAPVSSGSQSMTITTAGGAADFASILASFAPVSTPSAPFNFGSWFAI